MNSDTCYPSIKETIRFRKEKVGVYYLDQVTESMGYLRPQEAVILALCNGLRRSEEIVALVGEVFETDRETAAESVASVLDKCKDTVLVFNERSVAGSRQLAPGDFVYHAEPMPPGRYPTYSGPFVISLNVTARCNFACRYCYKGHLTTRELEELSGEEIHDIIDQAVALGVKRVFVTGGEPFLRPDLEEIAAHFLEHDIFPYISTNGWLVTPARAAALRRAGLKHVQVSFDSPLPSMQDFLSGVPGSHQGILRALDIFSGAGMTVRTKCVVTRYNIEQLGWYLDECYLHGVKLAGISPFFPGNYAEPEKSRDLIPDAAQMQEAARVTAERREKYQGLMQADAFSPILRFDKMPEKGMCGGMATSLSILADGTIHACDLLEEREELKFGNVRNTTIAGAWHSEKAETFRNPDPARFAEPCRSCETARFCRTGCLSYSLVCYGDLYAPDPRCRKASKVDGISEYIQG